MHLLRSSSELEPTWIVPTVWVPTSDAEVDAAVLLSSPTKRPFVVRMASGEIAEVTQVRPRDARAAEC